MWICRVFLTCNKHFSLLYFWSQCRCHCSALFTIKKWESYSKKYELFQLNPLYCECSPGAIAKFLITSWYIFKLKWLSISFSKLICKTLVQNNMPYDWYLFWKSVIWTWLSCQEFWNPRFKFIFEFSMNISWRRRCGKTMLFQHWADYKIIWLWL